MPDAQALPFDLSDPALFDAGIPHAEFDALRALPGLGWNPLDDGGAGFWAVGRYDDVVHVSRHPEVFSSAAGHIQIYNVDEDALSARASMIDMDPPEHTRLRRLVAQTFLPPTIRAHEPVIAARVDAALDRLVQAGGGDWVAHIAEPLPIAVICDILGVPEDDHALMVELTDHLVAGTSSSPLPADAYGNTTPLRLLPFNSPAAHGLRQYADRLGAMRRTAPRDDLVSALVGAEVDGERLTEAEFSNFFRLLVFAGNETTRSAMSHLALQWMAFPAVFERLAAEPALIDGVVEEVIRLASPILYFRRTALCDTELSGTRIRAGERVVMWYASANFDSSRFPDPHRMDPQRERVRAHAGFGGGGVHICLGAWLARLELRLLIRAMVQRRLELRCTAEPRYVDSNFVNGLASLEVTVSSRT